MQAARPSQYEKQDPSSSLRKVLWVLRISSVVIFAGAIVLIVIKQLAP